MVHAVYRPWGSASVTYWVQHVSLLTTTFVFVMGLLFKVKGVSQSVASYRALTVVMLLLCVAFAVAWLASMVLGTIASLMQQRVAKASAATAAAALGSASSELGDENVAKAAGSPPLLIDNPLFRAVTRAATNTRLHRLSSNSLLLVRPKPPPAMATPVAAPNPTVTVSPLPASPGAQRNARLAKLYSEGRG